VNEIAIEIEQVQDYHFRVHFDKQQYADLDIDEPAPLGKDQAPNPARLLAAAVGSCLSASLFFCARKAHIDLGELQTTVKTQLSRNERGRLRVSKIEVEIDPHMSEAMNRKAVGCYATLEDFCVVTESVRHGINVAVSVKGADQVRSPKAVVVSV
jgi:organic hydroperoxide reductase OsmC/OhrA